MAANYSGLRTLLNTHLAAQWPEAYANGIFFTLASLKQQADAGKLPFILLDIEFAANPGELEDERGEFPIDYITLRASDDIATFDALIAKLQALQDALDNQPMPTGSGSIVCRPTISASRTLALNTYFEDSEQPYWSGRVLVKVQI